MRVCRSILSSVYPVTQALQSVRVPPSWCRQKCVNFDIEVACCLISAQKLNINATIYDCISKMLTSGGFAPWPLTTGFATGPHWGGTAPDTTAALHVSHIATCPSNKLCTSALESPGLIWIVCNSWTGFEFQRSMVKVRAVFLVMAYLDVCPFGTWCWKLQFLQSATQKIL